MLTAPVLERQHQFPGRISRSPLLHVVPTNVLLKRRWGLSSLRCEQRLDSRLAALKYCCENQGYELTYQERKTQGGLMPARHSP